MGRARSIFDSTPDKDVVSWNSIISGYAENGLRREPLDLFMLMRRSGTTRPDRATLAIILRLCADSEDRRFGCQVHGLAVRMGLASDVVTGSAVLDMYAKCESFGDSLRAFREMPERNSVSWSATIAGLCAGILSLDMGRQIHGDAVKTGFASDPVVGTSVLDMYAKCDRLRDAERAFRLLPKKNLQTWNAMVVAFVREDLGYEALELFRLMNKFCVGFDDVSLSGVFSACAGIEAYLQGLEVHGLAIKTGFMTNICVANAMLDMYGKCRAVVEACNVFDDMERRDGVSWNAIITALEQNGRYEETLFHFNMMLCHEMEPDEFTYGSVLKACGALESTHHGIKIHNRILKSGMGLDTFVGSAIIDMYCKCGCIGEALKLHERMEEKPMVSWNAIISGFTDNKRSEEAQKFFSEFLDTGLKPDKFTYSTVLDTCANLATVVLGKQIHAQIIKQDLQMDVYISSTLVDMYSKCGNMEESLMMFQMMRERDLVSWNAIISGPNHTTFIAILRACGHVGLVDEGMRYFNLMREEYKLEPRLEHYSCMVDIIGRSGRIREALELIKDMPFEPDAIIWRTLMSVCKIGKNVEVAERAANSILELDPDDSSACILLSNIYAEAGKWEEVLRMRSSMRDNQLKKVPGCSWIEVKSEVHSFLAGDRDHSKRNEIYIRLDELIGEMKRVEYCELDL
ncbi:Pentatricopeptide repeat-containing protein [Acorus calamus]|uniref:Pentatricopeptide repeat-containing protein n=1 Tax=Acorus calamus TaxID=4465 RepID=A0AAV9CH70_ACOCL|nr:Pentatricopeptide repeat-containing protein [Acorus calamus]